MRLVQSIAGLVLGVGVLQAADAKKEAAREAALKEADAKAMIKKNPKLLK